jgi:hypothetical protein
MSESTRGIAMGDANLTSRDDDVIFYGPAQLAIARGTSIAAERYMDGLASGSVSTSSRIAAGGIGVGAEVVEGRNTGDCALVAQLPNGDAPARTITNSLAVVGGALPFRKYRFGVAAKYAGEQADAGRESAFLADLGVARDYSLGDFAQITAALAVTSIGPSPSRAFALGVPRQALLGLSSGGPVGPFDLAVALQGGLAHEGAGTVSMKNRGVVGGGAELGYAWLDGYSISVRAGARTAYAYDLARHFTFGAGLVLDRLTFDYAFEQLAGSNGAHRLGIRLR